MIYDVLIPLFIKEQHGKQTEADYVCYWRKLGEVAALSPEVAMLQAKAKFSLPHPVLEARNGDWRYGKNRWVPTQPS